MHCCSPISKAPWSLTEVIPNSSNSQKTTCASSLGDGRYSLLGQPLQYNLSICPPLLHGQSAYSVHQVRGSSISLRATGISFSSRPLLEPSPQPAGWTRETTQRAWTQWEEPSPLLCSFFSPLPSANREGLFISHWPLSGRSDCLVGWDPQGRILFLNLSDRLGCKAVNIVYLEWELSFKCWRDRADWSMETGARDKHSNLPPLTWGQQTLVSDRMLNPHKKSLTL